MQSLKKPDMTEVTEHAQELHDYSEEKRKRKGKGNKGGRKEQREGKRKEGGLEEIMGEKIHREHELRA